MIIGSGCYIVCTIQKIRDRNYIINALNTINFYSTDMFSATVFFISYYLICDGLKPYLFLKELEKWDKLSNPKSK